MKRKKVGKSIDSDKNLKFVTLYISNSLQRNFVSVELFPHVGYIGLFLIVNVDRCIGVDQHYVRSGATIFSKLFNKCS